VGGDAGMVTICVCGHKRHHHRSIVIVLVMEDPDAAALAADSNSSIHGQLEGTTGKRRVDNDNHNDNDSDCNTEADSSDEEENEHNNDTSSNNHATDSSSAVAISKNQLKRMRRAENMEQFKKQKKAAEKERKRANKRRKQEERSKSEADQSAANVTDTSTTNVVALTDEERLQLRQERKELARTEFIAKCNSRFSVIIDCDFESCHAERPIKSLSQQLAFCYAFNRKSPNPVHLYFTGLGPKLQAQMAKSHCEGWQNIVMTEKCYTQLPEFFSHETNRNETASDPEQRQLVYLSADAEETITEFDPSCAYIIGGIVDRNRFKGITHKKAVSQGLRLAKLPIREHVAMAGTPVLTVNHVFEIMLLYEQTKCWKTTLEKVLPQRKDPKMKDGQDENDEAASNDGCNGAEDSEDNVNEGITDS
jgi:tRNA (guanine9-N1)-methyltransferase